MSCEQPRKVYAIDLYAHSSFIKGWDVTKNTASGQLAKNYHFSLFWVTVSDKEKRFITFASGVNVLNFFIIVDVEAN
jgi:hypothetical protein